MPNDIPSLASLRRKRPAPRPAPPALTLFDTPLEPEQAVPETPRIWTVSALIRNVQSLIERSFNSIAVEGEISNWRPSASGHCYFTLKDRDAQLSIVLFRRQAQLLRFAPKDGDSVRVRGTLGIYQDRGQMQLIAESMEPLGLGAMLAALQALKTRLRSEGLFDRTRPLPAFPRCIGVITSLQGAALRDIVKVCKRRHAAVNLLVYPAAVQGPNCAREVAAGLRWFSSHPNLVDVILVARGGGSFEDLHGFNDEALVRAIAASSLPIITGIGHATDSVLADSAADLCAPTPSAAAELLTAAQHNVEARLQTLSGRLTRAYNYLALTRRQQLSRLAAEGILRRSRDLLHRRAQNLDDLTFRSHSACNRLLLQRNTAIDRLEARLRQQHPTLRLSRDHRRLESVIARLNALRITAPGATRLAAATAKLDAISPLRVLDRGYALVYLEDGRKDGLGDEVPTRKLLRDPADAPPNSRITARLAHGSLSATVIATKAVKPPIDPSPTKQ